ncbi:type VI secretion system lipoprotein TssJ [Xenorhabdus littoralis]|uniref:type VI secretion system lipoprotein TssJ n=1 Tax=Xenorhabdus littoralis TaxID=2582835 RepID=UPI0029E7D2DD|nr:type VI secretion system lipoprotein TssJ [Xenorhabdus sp. psl]MDX7989789.1 type VI secretion system lipoprotein TssJ [Xenorhabdus sp. psl]
MKISLPQKKEISINSLNSIGWLFRAVFLSLFLLTIAGCSSEEKKLPPYKIIFDTASGSNNSAPLKMRVILLKSSEKFMSADFFSLQENAQNVLDDKLINEDQLFVRPSQPIHCLLEKNKSEANYIGIIAEYQQLNGKKWRLSFPVPIPEKPAFYEFWRSVPDELRVCVKVTNNGLSLIKKCDLSCTAGNEENDE